MWHIDNLCNHLTGFTSTSKSFSMDLLPDGYRIWGIVTFATPVNIYLSTITYYFFLLISRLRRQKLSMSQAPITSTRFQTRLHRVGELIKVGARFYMKRQANQYLTSIRSNISPFCPAIIALNAAKYLIIGPTARERPVTMTTVKAIGFLFSRIMNFSPRCVTPPLHSQPLRLNWSPRVLEIPRLCLIICQTREKQRGKDVQGSANASI